MITLVHFVRRRLGIRGRCCRSLDGREVFGFRDEFLVARRDINN